MLPFLVSLITLGRMMGPPQGVGSGQLPPESPFAIVTEAGEPLTTESDETLVTEAAP
jgi:hypothetical protein